MGFVPATGRVGETITITGVNLIGATSVSSPDRCR
jgi:hypothetical protein